MSREDIRSGPTGRGRARQVLTGPVVGLLAGAVLFAAATLRPPARDHDRSDGPPWTHDGPEAGAPDAVSSPDAGVLSPSPVLFIVIAGVIVGIAIRHRRPRTAFGLVVLATAGYLSLGGPAPPAFVAPALALHTLARAVPPRRWGAATAAFVPMLLAAEVPSGFATLAHPETYLRFVFALALLVVPTLIGQNRDARRAALRLEREEELRRVADEERLRMARDIHDVVGHGLSTISLQSGVALHVLDRDPQQARACLEAIRAASTSSLADVRAAIGVLRTPGETGPLRPAPGLADLAELTGPVEAAGGRVRLRVDGTGSDVSRVVGQVAYRVVQECLTNAARHAPGADVDVRVRRAGGSLLVEVADDGPLTGSAPPEGNGLRGMRERVQAVGGSLTLHPRPAGGLQVLARLPVAGVPSPGAATAAESARAHDRETS